MAAITATKGRELIEIMKKVFGCFLCALFLTVVFAGCGGREADPAQAAGSGTEEKSNVQTEAGSGSAEGSAGTAEDSAGSAEDGSGTAEGSAASAAGEYLEGLHHVEIEVKDYGTMALELDADTAPITVTNFIGLAQDGFYDGLTFHRIISGFMIQGGDPLGNGSGGADQTIKGEFLQNGVENDISHKRGVISMARAQDPDSASSQFFIVHEDSEFLDGSYAAFGHVTEGMEIVDKICGDVAVQDDNGTVAPEDQPVITSIKVID